MPGGRETRFDMVFDAEFETKDGGLIASDSVAQVDSSNAIIDLGDGQYHGMVLIDVSAIEIADNDELYEIIAQGSTKSDFADTIVNLSVLPLGAKEVMAGNGDQDSATGNYRLPFSNVWNDTIYRYFRLYVDVTGTIGTGINFTAFVGRIDRSL